MAEAPKKSLSGLENTVMQVIWSEGPCSADRVRQALADKKALKDSTVRTILRRLEEKGFVTHEAEGRAYVYRHLIAPESAAARAVRQIIDRFCGGSVEGLLMGLVGDRVLDARELKELAEKIARSDAGRRRRGRSR